MKKNVYVSVSTDPISEYQKIVDYAAFMQDKADMLHCDVMDGKFVASKTYDSTIVDTINQNCLLMLDVHLMIENPQDFVDDYIDAGANIVTIHYEAVKDKELLSKTLKSIKSRGALAGLAICPDTQFKDFRLSLFDCDVVLVMSVVPGASGQKFMPSALDKIRELDKFRTENKVNFKIEVDGGVNDDNSKALIAAGADILVSGSFVCNAPDKVKAIEELKTM